ncbi:hypothetical protein [Shewanella frigidimarina]|uniref:hypothetical protein n=1 Tax=Shewanella frigidimarina TaxID=56812 RepID=UPI003D792C8B
MINMLDLPYLAKIPANKTALKEHRQNHPSLYERTFTHNDQIVRYYGDLPSVCVGQYVSQTLDFDGEYLFFHQFENQEIYALYVKDRVVQREQTGNHENIIERFAYEFHKELQIYVTSEHFQFFKETKEPPKVVKISLVNIPDEFNLTSKSSLNPLQIGIIAAIGILIIIYITLSSPPEPPPEAQINPWEKWGMEFISQAPADTGLQQASIALAYKNLLPPDWTTEGVSVSGQNIIMQLKPTQDGLKIFDTLIAFSEQYPELNLDIKNQLVTFKVKAREKPELVSLGHYPQKLNDALLKLGAANVSLSNDLSVGKVSRITVRVTFTETSLVMLNMIADSVKNEPVFLRQLSVNNGGGSGISFTLDLVIEGVDSII